MAVTERKSERERTGRLDRSPFGVSRRRGRRSIMKWWAAFAPISDWNDHPGIGDRATLVRARVRLARGAEFSDFRRSSPCAGVHIPPAQRPLHPWYGDQSPYRRDCADEEARGLQLVESLCCLAFRHVEEPGEAHRIDPYPLRQRLEDRQDSLVDGGQAARRGFIWQSGGRGRVAVYVAPGPARTRRASGRESSWRER